MSERLAKFCVVFEAREAIVFTLERTDAAYGERTVTLAAGSYYFLDDSGDALDVITALNTAVLASDDADDGWGVGELDDFAFGLNAFGQVVCSGAASQTFTITWSGAETLRDRMRYSGATTDVAFPGELGARVVEGLYLPQQEVNSEVPSVIRATAQSESPTTGKIQTIHYGGVKERVIRMWVPGCERDDEYSEYWDFFDFHALAAQGLRFRYYPDVTVTAAFARVSEPYGYEVLTMKKSNWEERQVVSGWDQWHDFEMVCRRSNLA